MDTVLLSLAIAGLLLAIVALLLVFRLRSALREDPDVVLIGEMRDLETISTAITVAETGHLVLATLHTNSAAQSIDRMIDVFPPHQQQQIRIQLAGVLQGIVSQRLIALVGGGRIAAKASRAQVDDAGAQHR